MEIAPLSPDDEALYEAIQRRKRERARRERPIYWAAALVATLCGLAAVAALASDGDLLPALGYGALVLGAASVTVLAGRSWPRRAIVVLAAVAATAGLCVWPADQSLSSAPFVWLVPGGFAVAFAASAACAVPLGRLRRVTPSRGAGLGALTYLCYAVPLNVYVSADPRAAFHFTVTVGGRLPPSVFLGFAVLIAQILFWLASLAGVALAALFGILAARLAHTDSTGATDGTP